MPARLKPATPGQVGFIRDLRQKAMDPGPEPDWGTLTYDEAKQLLNELRWKPQHPTPSQVEYAKHLLKQVGGDEPDWSKMNSSEVSALIDGLKQKRGEPVWYGNGQFSHWKHAAYDYDRR